MLSSKVELQETDRLLVLDFTLSNTSDNDLYFLNRNTPFESCDCFSVTRDGAEIKYDGPFFKKGVPMSSDYIHVKSGESVSAKYTISNFYDVSQKGTYEFRLKKPFLVSLKFETEVFVETVVKYVLQEDKYRPTLGQLARCNQQ
ncbi:MAG: hypothetical protein EKK64_06845 [Neisseriaceae bacterium]|nr:MAG: hypothetical protein EKK64_06845 [Neisseriaceae bacterium]